MVLNRAATHYTGRMSEQFPGSEDAVFKEIFGAVEVEIPLALFMYARERLYDFLKESFRNRTYSPDQWIGKVSKIAAHLKNEFEQYLDGVSKDEANEVLVQICDDAKQRVDWCNDLLGSKVLDYDDIIKPYTESEIIMLTAVDDDGDQVELTDELARDLLMRIYHHLLMADLEFLDVIYGLVLEGDQ
jgi:hypothetical protein